MNLQTVAQNLRNTIAGKEKMLNEQWNKMAFGDPSWQGDIGKQMAMQATIEFLKINIDELKRILQDVEQCIDEVDTLKEDLNAANGRVRQLERRASANSWEGAVDRQSGAFDESELRGRDGWL